MLPQKTEAENKLVIKMILLIKYGKSPFMKPIIKVPNMAKITIGVKGTAKTKYPLNKHVHHLIILNFHPIKAAGIPILKNGVTKPIRINIP